MTLSEGPWCDDCGEPLTANSAVYDDYGTARWYCYNEDCDAEPTEDPW